MRDDKHIDVNDPEYDSPIVAEVRRIREQIAEEFNHDMDALFRHVQELERQRAAKPRSPGGGSA